MKIGIVLSVYASQREFQLDELVGCAVFFARCPPNLPYEELLHLFNKFGEVKELNLYRRWAKAKNSKGCGTVVFADRTSAELAMSALNGKQQFADSEATMVVEWCAPGKLRSTAQAAQHCSAATKRGNKQKVEGTIAAFDNLQIMLGPSCGASPPNDLASHTPDSLFEGPNPFLQASSSFPSVLSMSDQDDLVTASSCLQDRSSSSCNNSFTSICSCVSYTSNTDASFAAAGVASPAEGSGILPTANNFWNQQASCGFASEVAATGVLRSRNSATGSPVSSSGYCSSLMNAAGMPDVCTEGCTPAGLVCSTLDYPSFASSSTVPLGGTEWLQLQQMQEHQQALLIAQLTALGEMNHTHVLPSIVADVSCNTYATPSAPSAPGGVLGALGATSAFSAVQSLCIDLDLLALQKVAGYLDAVGALSGAQVSVDATAAGLQLLLCGTADQLASACNTLHLLLA